MSKIKRLIIEEREFKSSDNIHLGREFNKYVNIKTSFHNRLNKFKDKLKKLIDIGKLKLKFNKKSYFSSVVINFDNEDFNREYKSLVDEDSKLNETHNEMLLYFDIEEKNFNRTHFPSGIPSIFKGINLGYYLYKSLGKELKYISSEGDASNDVKRIWNNLLRDSDFYSFYIKKTYDDYKIGIIYKPYLNDVKSNLIEWVIEYGYSNAEIILDNKLLKELQFTDKDFSITKYDLNDRIKRNSDRYLYLNLCGKTISMYDTNSNKWKELFFDRGILYEIITRDVNRYLKYIKF